MVKVEALEYDGNSAGGDGNQTKRTAWENAGTTRVKEFGYDWRNRQTSVKGEAAFYEEYLYDNLDRRQPLWAKALPGASLPWPSVRLETITSTSRPASSTRRIVTGSIRTKLLSLVF